MVVVVVEMCNGREIAKQSTQCTVLMQFQLAEQQIIIIVFNSTNRECQQKRYINFSGGYHFDTVCI